jgi:hypothetical protein
VTQEASVGGGLLQQKARDAIWKITKAKRAGGAAQVVERLLAKALSSNPSTTHTHKKRMTEHEFSATSAVLHLDVTVGRWLSLSDLYPGDHKVTMSMKVLL